MDVEGAGYTEKGGVDALGSAAARRDDGRAVIHVDSGSFLLVMVSATAAAAAVAA